MKRRAANLGADGRNLRPWNTPVIWKSTDAWSANGGSGRGSVPGVRDRRGFVTLPGGGRKRSLAA